MASSWIYKIPRNCWIKILFWLLKSGLFSSKNHFLKREKEIEVLQSYSQLLPILKNGHKVLYHFFSFPILQSM